MLLHCHSRRAEPLTTLSSHQEGTRWLGRGCGGQCDTSLCEKSQEDLENYTAAGQGCLYRAEGMLVNKDTRLSTIC